MLGASALAAVACPAPAMAQASTGGTADSARLTEALRTLGRNPQSFDALIAAGEASLRLDDVNAALGFFRRAEGLRPQAGAVKAGLGSALARQRQPLEALRLFAEAERAGGLSLAHVGDRGLAYDLIGDNSRAQQDYQLALAAGADPVVSRRLALSLAIAGDQRLSDATLLPLLQKQDLAAYRTRAFALAILGKGDEAVSIAETMLPATVSGRMAPYLRYMPRLTRAQQAAAANLGAFPPADQIGRDDPTLAAYAASIGATARAADSRLVPSGAPLGQAPVQVAAATRPVSAAPRPSPAPSPAPAATAAVVTAAPAPAVLAAARPASAAPAATRRGPIPERARAMLEQHPNTVANVTRTAAAAPPQPVTPPVAQTVTVAQAITPPVVQPVAAAQPQPAALASAAGPPNELPAVETTARPVVVAALESTPPTPLPVASPPVETSPTPSVQAAPLVATDVRAPEPIRVPSLSEAFADLRDAPAPTPASAGAVDITRIQPRREQATPPKAAASPKPPPVPSRQWVQVATGRDTKALAFDWRRIKREAGGLLDKQNPLTADWGQTNRLVVGPFASASTADQLIAKLKDKKIDAFRFTSAAGEAVTPLD